MNACFNNTEFVVSMILLDFRGVSVGGKGSAEFVVKGSHKDIPKELLDELKAICQVLYL